MNQLEEARQIINRTDREMAALFEQREKAVEQVAKYKQDHGLPIFDPSREAEVLQKNAVLIRDDTIRTFYVRFLQNTMEISKQYQKQMMEGMRVAYSGVAGAFANIAASRIFPGGHLESYPDFDSAYQSVVDGVCDCCVLPLENSYAGQVGQVMDLMFSGPLYVHGIYGLPVVQNLIGLKGAHTEEITEVISHPQALIQCAGFINRHGFTARQCSNTARAAMEVAQEGDPHLAAIASAETAGLYGLEVLEKAINEDALNTTRFAVFTRAQPEESTLDGFLLLFKVNHVAGTLAAAVSIISSFGFNMKVLHSRPVKDVPWQYYFYVEAEGNDRSDAGREMLQQLQTCCSSVKIAGHFLSDLILREEAKP